MPVPADADDVLAAVRLGWYLAEVRGRNRPDCPSPPALAMPGREGHALPLRAERTAPELRIEAQAVLTALATRLKVDGDAGTTARYPWRGHLTYSQAVDASAQRLAGLRGKNDAGAPGEWASLTELLYRFDAHIQDGLTASSDSQACGYQLGRGLAESYWALDPGAPDHAPTAASWVFLLGGERCGEMSRLLGRMSAYMHQYSASSIAGSMRVWSEVAKDPDWRKSAHGDLYLQLRRWYELVILKQDPTTLIKPYALVRNFRVIWRAARLFWVQLLLSALSVAALAGLAWALPQPSVKAWVNVLLGVAAVTGLSVAGLTAQLKNAAAAMLTRLRQDAYTDLIAIAITTVRPPPPQAGRPQRRVTARLVRQRSLTPSTPN